MMTCPVCGKNYKSLVTTPESEVLMRCEKCHEKLNSRTHTQTIDFLADLFEKRGFEVAEKSYRGGGRVDLQLLDDNRSGPNIYHNIEVKSGTFNIPELQRGVGQTFLNTLYHTKQSFLSIPEVWRERHSDWIYKLLALTKFPKIGLIIVKENDIEIIGGRLNSQKALSDTTGKVASQIRSSLVSGATPDKVTHGKEESVDYSLISTLTLPRKG